MFLKTLTCRVFHFSSLLLFFVVTVLSPFVHGAEQLPKVLERVNIIEQLGNQLPMDLSFTNHKGQVVTLKKMFEGNQPVLLTLNYFNCPMLCTLQLNGLVQGLRDLGWVPGKKFKMITLSIDHRETAELANEKRQAYLEYLEMGDIDWTFLVGDEQSIKVVADAVGFGFQYIEETGQYAHPAATYFLSHTGKVMRYLYGIQYDVRDLKFAFIDVSEGRMGSPIDKLILSCFSYDASLGQYGPFAMGIMRLGGAFTLVILGLFLFIYWRRETHRQSQGEH